MFIKVGRTPQFGIISEGFVEDYTAVTLSFLLHYLAEMSVPELCPTRLLYFGACIWSEFLLVDINLCVFIKDINFKNSLSN